ncbi:hypothetical protein GGI21_006349 [Coemansia aciculifera]|nr:hypothetical protein GGI21_006349 [Coemansia aciculifera]
MSTTTTTTTTKATPVDQFPNKVFVGNLSFKTTDGQLKDFFSDVSDVKEARIITRGPRSLGYGFVAYADEATVAKAVEMKNQTELDGRTITVESARPLSAEGGASEARPANKAGRRRPAHRATGKARIDGAQEGSSGSESQQQQAKEATSSSENVKPAAASTRQRAKRSANKKPAAASSAQPIVKEDRTPSETVVFVGNLPFETTDIQLAELFADFKISSAYVVVGQKNARSKGFGFVKFASHEEQTKAVEKFVSEPITVKTRVLNIKAAFSESPAAADSASESVAA